VTIIPNQHTGSTAGADRTWILVLAVTGWVVLTAVAVLLASGTWSVGQASDDDSPRPRHPSSGVDEPLPRTLDRSQPRAPRPRADHEGLIHAVSVMALIPRQPSGHTS
jgi:hypothetical protein